MNSADVPHKCGEMRFATQAASHRTAYSWYIWLALFQLCTAFGSNTSRIISVHRPVVLCQAGG